MSKSVTNRAEFASSLSKRAGQLALDFFRNRENLEIETKNGELDLVSIADRAVEEMIRGEISATFPDDAILGEEGGATDGASGLTWVIDPIDGTVPFVMGLPHWCVVLAVTEGPKTHLGITDVPVTGEHFVAQAGKGVTLDGVPLSLDGSKRIDQGLVAVGASERCDHQQLAGILRRLLAVGGMYYRNGSGANMLACVAAGRLAGYVEPAMNPWDSLAGLLMIEEAGGVIHPYPADARLGLTMGAAPGVWDDLRSIVESEFGDGLPEAER